MATDQPTESTSTTSTDSGIIKEQVKQGAQNAAQQAQGAAGQVVDTAKNQTTHALQGQMDKATTTLSSISQALRQTGQNLNGQNQGTIGQYVDRAADQVDNVNTYLQQRDVETLLGEAEDYARRSPAVFLGGAFALGILAARFIKSSSPGSRFAQNYRSGYSGRQSWNGSDTSQYSGTTGTAQSGTYDYSSVQYGTDDIGGTPTIERGYAPGLMGRDVNEETDHGA